MFLSPNQLLWSWLDWCTRTRTPCGRPFPHMRMSDSLTEDYMGETREGEARRCVIKPSSSLLPQTPTFQRLGLLKSAATLPEDRCCHSATSNCHRHLCHCHLRVKMTYPPNDTQAPALSRRPNTADLNPPSPHRLVDDPCCRPYQHVNDVLATSNCHRYLSVKISYPLNDTQAPAFRGDRTPPIANRQSPTSTRHRHIDLSMIPAAVGHISVQATYRPPRTAIATSA